MKRLTRLRDRIMGQGAAAVTIPPMDGAMRPNNILDRARVIARALEPDNLIFWQGEAHFSSGSRLLRAKDALPVRNFGREIGFLAASDDGRLAVGLIGAGVTIVATDGSTSAIGAHEVPHATAATFAGRDLIVCQGSDIHPNSEWRHDLMEAAVYGPGTGSVWLFDDVGVARQIGGSLRYPNGIAVGPRGRILVAESWNHRIVALNSPQSPATVVLDDLPGYPARLTPSEDGGFWLAVFARRSQLIEFVLRENEFRKRMMAEIDPDLWVAPAMRSGRSFLEPLQGGGVKQMGVLKPWAPSRSYGLVVRLGVELEPLQSFHSRADGNYHGTTSVLEVDGELLISSRGGDAIVGVALPGRSVA